MLPYLLIYTVSILFIFLGEKIKRRMPVLFYFFASLSILSLSIFAGLRDFSVGTDIATYGNESFYFALGANNIAQVLNYSGVGSTIENGYMVLNYIVSRFTSNVQWFYFVHALIVNILAMYGLLLFKNKTSTTFNWFGYLMCVFPITLCALRQSLSMGLLFVAFSYYFNKNKMVFPIILIALATQFHNSSIAAVILYLALIFLDKHIGLNKKLFIWIVFIFIICLFSSELINSLISFGFLSEKYIMYDGGYASQNLWNPILIRIPMLLIVYTLYRNDFFNNKSAILLIIPLFELALQPIKLFDLNVARILWYFNYLLPLSYSYAVQRLKIRNIIIGKFIPKIIIILLLSYIGLYSNIYEQVIGLDGLGLYPYTINK